VISTIIGERLPDNWAYETFCQAGQRELYGKSVSVGLAAKRTVSTSITDGPVSLRLDGIEKLFRNSAAAAKGSFFSRARLVSPIHGHMLLWSW
jgi:hypothetical protein